MGLNASKVLMPATAGPECKHGEVSACISCAHLFKPSPVPCLLIRGPQQMQKSSKVAYYFKKVKLSSVGNFRKDWALQTLRGSFALVLLGLCPAIQQCGLEVAVERDVANSSAHSPIACHPNDMRERERQRKNRKTFSSTAIQLTRRERMFCLEDQIQYCR